MEKYSLKDYVIPTTIENTNLDNKYGDKKFDTTDYVFLPCGSDVKSDRDFLIPPVQTDYAVCCGLKIKPDKTGQYNYTCDINLRSAGLFDTLEATSINRGYVYSAVGGHDNGICPCMRLDANKIAQKQQTDNPFVIKTVTDINGIVHHTIEFGEFPQTFVGTKLNKKLEDLFLQSYYSDILGRKLNNDVKYPEAYDKLIPTGKYYFGHYTGNTGYLTREFAFNGQKYVRADCNKCDSSSVYENGTYVSENSKWDWFKVEPIVWEIKNWFNLPKTINRFGTGVDNFIEVSCTRTIISGMNFFVIAGMPEQKFKTLWQNSTIRAYLNGYDIHEQIKKGNGNKKCMSKINFEHKGRNFFSEALEQYIVPKPEKQIEIIGSNIKPKRNSYGIEVATGKMSVGKQIEFYINNGQPFMLHGKSGIGKTRRVQDVDPNLTSIILRNGILPEEVIGKTIYPNSSTTTGGVWVPPAWYVDLCKKCEKEPDKKHVLFVDELTNVDEHEQSLVFHIILNNSIGPNFGVLPKNAVVVAAGNSKEESESAYNMTEPLFRRFNAHVYLEPDIKEWLEWANQINPAKNRPNVHPLVSSFVAANKDEVFFTDYDSEEPPKQAIDPRGWEQVSDILYNCNGSVARELIYNKVGKEIGESFVAHLISPPLSVQDVVDGNYTKDDIPHMFDTQYALALSLQYATEGQIAKVRQFVGNHLGSEMLSIFDTVWVGNDDERAILIDSLKQSQNWQPQAQQNEKVFDYKLTVDEWFGSKNSASINCEHEWQAKVLELVFDRMGKTWVSGKKYDSNNTVFGIYGSKTCYDNRGGHLKKSISNNNNYFCFEDVDFSKYLNFEEQQYVLQQHLKQKQQKSSQDDDLQLTK